MIRDLHEVAAGLGLAAVHVVAHPPATGFYRAVGCELVCEVAPQGRVTWARPLLRLPITL